MAQGLPEIRGQWCCAELYLVNCGGSTGKDTALLPVSTVIFRKLFGPRLGVLLAVSVVLASSSTFQGLLSYDFRKAMGCHRLEIFPALIISHFCTGFGVAVLSSQATQGLLSKFTFSLLPIFLLYLPFC